MDEEVELGGGNQDEELDPEMVKEGRKEEVEFMKDKLDMFEFGTYEQAMARSGGKPPTTTKWVEGWKNNDDGSRTSSPNGRSIRRQCLRLCHRWKRRSSYLGWRQESEDGGGEGERRKSN